LEENYRPDVRARPRLPLRRGFIREKVFTVRRRGKNRVHAGAKKKIKKNLKIIFF
jgi:hypothetical protein